MSASDSGVFIHFEGYGKRPRPHVFNLGAYRAGEPHQPTIDMKGWKKFVNNKARLAMNGRAPYDASSVAVQIVFIARTPYGSRDGDLWEQEVRWERPRDGVGPGRATKIDSTQPDFDNCLKSTLDAITGVVIADDVLVRGFDGSTMIYGPREGFKITVRPIGKVRRGSQAGAIDSK